MGERSLAPIVRTHLARMTGPMGIWQHAIGQMPDPTYGACTDDVARALLVDLAHARVLGWDAVAPDARRSLRFLAEAWDPQRGRFRNYRGQDRDWARTEPSEDCQGRALLAIGAAIGAGPGGSGVAALGASRGLLADALPMATGLRALRAIASSILGCAAALGGLDPDEPLHDEAAATLGGLAAALEAAFARSGSDPAWPWPEPVLTYENALLPHALIVAGATLGDDAMLRRGMVSLGWLIGVQTSGGGTFSPVGSDGWWPRGGARAHFAQQPIEAAATVLACRAAAGLARESRYRRAAERAHAWFLGSNDVGVPLATPETGGCYDGLERAGVNRNQGAESTLAWLISLEAIRDLRSTTAIPPRPAARTRALVAPAGMG